MVKRTNVEQMARFLGLASLGLGLFELLQPGRIQRLLRVRGSYQGLIRMLGVRELGHALLIFLQARPHQGVWTRVAGDALDLAVLGKAYTAPRASRPRIGMAAAAVAGLAALDVLAAAALARRQGEEQRYSTVTRSDLSTRTPSGAFRVVKSQTINKPAGELYRFWRDFTNLPQYMLHLEAVEALDERRSRWTAKAPADRQVTWEAEITADRPDELIAWQSLPGADVPNSGRVTFTPAPGGRGAIVRVEIEYRPPAGPLGKLAALLFGEEPGQQVSGDLRRFKQVMETGEVLRSDGSPSGLGQKQQLPARPAAQGALEWAAPIAERKET
ncbi:MAG: SRPBCC family protein [Chloroflexota bacterium]